MKAPLVEVPQASTGFSPFELLYGHCVWGPLSVLSESWQSSKRSGESVVSHVLSMREKLEKMMSMARYTNNKYGSNLSQSFPSFPETFRNIIFNVWLKRSTSPSVCGW
jgi:hypothetical protein